jgi:hypothetical protein
LEPPSADPHARWCERTGASRPLLLDCLWVNGLSGFEGCYEQTAFAEDRLGETIGTCLLLGHLFFDHREREGPFEALTMEAKSLTSTTGS